MTDEKWRSANRLIHYTQSAETVAAILQCGLLLVPNRRNVIERFLPNDDFSDREPQQFGMVSLTELPLDRAASHREKFGAFGICMSWEWALSKGAQRVIYIDDAGVVWQGFKWLFELARQQLGSNASMSLTNKVVAGVDGAALYHALLTLYEYMETSRNSSQVEWRIVNPLPIYHPDLADRPKLIKKLIADSKVSTMGVVQVEPADVEFLVCPKNQVRALRRLVPPQFRGVPILELDMLLSARALSSTLLRWLLALHRKRDRIRYVEKAPTADSLVIPCSPAGPWFPLPGVDHIQGYIVQPNAVHARTSLSFQYTDREQRWCELKLPIPEAIGLLVNLRLIAAEHGWKVPDWPPKS